jgi:hypothetical protein
MNTEKRKLANYNLRAEGCHLLKAEGNGRLPRSASASPKAFVPKDTASAAPKVTNGHPEALTRRSRPTKKEPATGDEDGGWPIVDGTFMAQTSGDGRRLA